MRFCQPHWDMLREEVMAQGMGDWIPDGEITALQMKDELIRGEDTKANFNPLMRCHWMIMNRSMNMAGLRVMSPDFGCPICFFNSQRNPDGSCPCDDPHCPGRKPGSVDDFEWWIKGPESCVASVKGMMEQRGWLQ